MAAHDAGARDVRRDQDRRIDGRSGGSLLVWLGVVLLTGMGWGVGLVGVGAILLVEQVARWRLGRGPTAFWMVAGLLAVGIGAAIIAGLKISLVPILLIVVGGVLIASTFRGGGGRGGGGK